MSELNEISIANRLNVHLETQLALCDGLEKIADSLPNDYCRQECLKIASQIYATVKSAHQFEENELFPLIQSGDFDVDPKATLDQLHCDHWEDESYACELQEALLSLITNPEYANKEALGYMLRGFFTNLRRHIAFEREYISLKFKEIQNSQLLQHGQF